MGKQAPVRRAPIFALVQRRSCLRSTDGAAGRLHGGEQLTLLSVTVVEEVGCSVALGNPGPVLTFRNAGDVVWFGLQGWIQSGSIELAHIFKVGGASVREGVQARVDVTVNGSRKAKTILKQACVSIRPPLPV